MLPFFSTRSNFHDAGIMSNRSLSGQTDEEPRINIRISSSPPITIPFHPRQRPRQYHTYAYEPPRDQDGPLNIPSLLEPFETEPQTMYQSNRSMMQLGPSPSIVTSMPTPSLFPQTTPMQDLGDVVQFNQERANASQRRNQASQIHVLNTSFGWDGDVLTSQGLPLARHRDVNISSMDVYPETFSGDTRLFTDQFSDDLGELPWLANGYQGSTHDYLDSSLDFPDPQGGYSGHIAGLTPGPREHGRTGSSNNQRALVVEAGVEQMVKNLDSLYRRISVGLDIAGAHEVQRFFMCPYAMRYPDRVSHNCFQRLNTIAYVKQHLRNNHHDAISCPNRCQDRRPGTKLPRSRPSAGLSFGADVCVDIIKRRSDRSRTHKQQWERIYRILFPGADRISDPYIGDSTIKRLRHLFKFMENHGIECLAAVYAQLPETVSYPEPEIMYRRAFCTWLPRVFESRFPPQGHLLLGGFLSQINAFLRDDSFLKDSFSGPASLRSVSSLSDVRQMGQPGPSFTAMSHMGSLSSQQPSYSAIPSPYMAHQQSSFQPLEGASFLESSYVPTPSEISYLDTPIPFQTDIDCATPLLDGTNFAYQFDGHNFAFDEYGPIQGSPSQFFEDADGSLSQPGTGDF